MRLNPVQLGGTVPLSVAPSTPSVCSVHVRTPVFPPIANMPKASTSSHAWPLDSKFRVVDDESVKPIAVLPENATVSPDTVYGEPVGASKGISAFGRVSAPSSAPT